MVRVDPKDLETHFGAGVTLKAVTLEITGEPVTQGAVKKVLGWLDSLGNNQLDGQRYRKASAKNKAANELNILDFDRR